VKETASWPAPRPHLPAVPYAELAAGRGRRHSAGHGRARGPGRLFAVPSPGL